MREEGLLFDEKSGGFLHFYRDNGKLIIHKRPCRHEHSKRMIVSAQ
jgi:hypothetical protein